MENKHYNDIDNMEKYVDITADYHQNVYIDDDFVFPSNTQKITTNKEGYEGMAPRRSHFATPQKGHYAK